METKILPTARQKDEFVYFYYLAYYPTRFEVSEELDDMRKYIWGFKDGNYSKEVAVGLVEDIEHLKLSYPLSNWCLCVVPASTAQKTETRFKLFCETFCKSTPVNNGFNYITNKSDREAKHLAEERNAVNIIDSIDFNNVAGKRILLFDDIYTTGKSFLRVARKLKVMGALEVKGIFLGKTHWLEE
jgi:ATP-dependent DNA helicase RecQ